MCPCYEQGGRDVSPRFIQITRVNLYLPTLSQMESVGLGNRTHQIPRFQGFLPAKPWATQGNSWAAHANSWASFAQTMGCSRRFMGWFRQSMGCSWRFMGRFRQSMGIICPNHRYHLPKPRCFWLFDGLFSPIAADGLLFLAGSLS